MVRSHVGRRGEAVVIRNEDGSVWATKTVLTLHFILGTSRSKPVIRTTGQSRIQNSQISWTLGFFGPSFYEIADPELTSFTNGSLFDVVIIPEGGVENNTLASYVRNLNKNPRLREAC